jgi:hypothetical protein
MRRALCIIALVAAALSASPTAAAWAHTPVLEQAARSDTSWQAPAGIGPARLFPGAPDLPDPRVSRAVYGTLGSGEFFDAYRLEGPTDAKAKSVDIPVQVLVPSNGSNPDLRPTLLIVGFGNASGPTRLPQAIVEHLRSVQTTVPVTVVADPGGTRGSEYEPFVGEQLQRGAAATMTIEPGRTYYVLVYDPDGATGEYRIALGTAESFTLAETVGLPLALLRIKLGLYGQDAVHWDFAVLLALVTGAVVALVSWLVARGRRRRAMRT